MLEPLEPIYALIEHYESEIANISEELKITYLNNIHSGREKQKVKLQDYREFVDQLNLILEYHS